MTEASHAFCQESAIGATGSGASLRVSGVSHRRTAQFTPRNALHPIQAILNYATGIAAARITRAVIAHGLDPGFGFFHDGRKPGRLSLLWDCLASYQRTVDLDGRISGLALPASDKIVFRDLS